MIDMNNLNTVEEILEWFEETVNKTNYGTIGVKVRVARGRLQYVNPEYNPALRVEHEEYDAD